MPAYSRVPELQPANSKECQSCSRQTRECGAPSLHTHNILQTHECQSCSRQTPKECQSCSRQTRECGAPSLHTHHILQTHECQSCSRQIPKECQSCSRQTLECSVLLIYNIPFRNKIITTRASSCLLRLIICPLPTLPFAIADSVCLRSPLLPIIADPRLPKV